MVLVLLATTLQFNHVRLSVVIQARQSAATACG